MKVGVGYCNTQDSFTSGKEAAEIALKKGSINRADFVFSFCSGNADYENFFRGLQSVLGNEVPIIGGAAIGIITNDEISYEGYPSGVAVIQSETLKYRVASTGNLNKDEKAAGIRLAEELSLKAENTPLFIFYDSIKKSATETTPPVMNSSSPLIEGIEERCKSDVLILGAGLMGDYLFSPVKQFCGSFVGSQSVVGAVLKGDFKTYYRIMHGCTPLNGVYHTITKIEGPVIYEVDGKPIVEMIDTIYGHRDWRTQHPVQLVTLGVHHGKKYELPQESDYVNRLITGSLPGGEGVGLFEEDLEEGMEIQFMLRNAGEMVASARTNSGELMKQIESDGKKAVWGLYIDCAGRTSEMSNTEIEEASEVQKVFNRYNIPLLGFYSGVEVAPLVGKSRGLDWTGVLIVFAEG